MEAEPQVGDRIFEDGEQVVDGVARHNGNTGGKPTIRVRFESAGAEQSFQYFMLEPAPEQLT